MRSAMMGMGLLAVVLQCLPAQAQEPEEEITQAPLPAVSPYTSYREQTQSATARLLIHERALHRARNRQARLESQKWLGISTQRPTFPGDYFCTDVNPNIYGWPYGSTRFSGTRSPWAR